MKENRSIDCAAYERPAVEILEVTVEAGFEVSPGNDGLDYMGSECDNGTLEDGGIW